MAPAASTIHDNFSPVSLEAPLLDSSSINATVGAGVTVGASVVLEDDVDVDVDGNVGDIVGNDVEVDVEWLDEDDGTKPACGWHVRTRS